MAHVLEFAVDGLCGRKGSYTRELNRDVNIFFGDNGSGKTSLLKILHSAMSGETAILKNVPFDQASVKIFSVTYDRIFTRIIKQKEVTPDVTRMPEIELDHTQSIRIPSTLQSIEWETRPKDPPTKGWSHVYLPISRLYESLTRRHFQAIDLYYSSVGNKSSEENLDERFAESLKSLWGTYSADVSKSIRQAQQKGLANILRAVLSKAGRKKARARPTDSKQAYRRVASFLARESGFSNVLGPEEQFAEKYSSDPNLRNVVRDIEEVEQSIEKAVAPRERLRESVGSMFAGGKSVFFSDKDVEVRLRNNKTIGLPFLSSGEKQLLYILVETLIADVNSIIVDEPEISMHVDWQKKLVQTMQALNPNSQLILATHSPEIMADVPDKKIFRI